MDLFSKAVLEGLGDLKQSAMMQPCTFMIIEIASIYNKKDVMHH